MTMLRLLPDLDHPEESPGRGILTGPAGSLPLVAMSVTAEITGMVAGMTVSQRFRNPHDCPVEATYIFPLPDRAAVTGFDVTIGSRHIAGLLEERQAARDTYDAALAAGQRAAIVEEERPDVFTTRVGNLAPGEEATVALTLAGPVACEFGEATFRVPLVVAPRYIPGSPLEGDGVGDGTALDTDLVPDASRITPPVLLPGAPNPVALEISVRLNPAGLTIDDVWSSLHAVMVTGELPGAVTVVLPPGQRIDRDFILRFRVTDDSGPGVCALAAPDGSEASGEGTVLVTVIPPARPDCSSARDVVLLVDRSGSMAGWKMVAARRAAARIIDSLTSADRFAVLAFDHLVEQPPGQTGGRLLAASDRNRYQAVEWLGRLDARGGTELAIALAAAGAAVVSPAATAPGARSVIVVTDGQVGNEDQLVRMASEAGVRMHCVGVDQAANGGLLRRLAAVTGGHCDLVESEDRLDDVLADLRRRVGHPVLEDVTVAFDAMAVADDTVTPTNHVDLYPGVPLVVSGRYRGRPGGRVTVTGKDGTTFSADVAVAATTAAVAATTAAAAVWARSHLRDLEDRYATLPASCGKEQGDLADRIVAVSRRHRVLCRFTAWVAVDDTGNRVKGPLHRIVQPVEQPAGWAASIGAVQTMMAPMNAAQPAIAPLPVPNITTPPPVRYTPSTPPGTAPPLRAMGPARRLFSAGAPMAPTIAETPPAPPLSAYHPRFDELLAAVDELGDPTDPVVARRLAGVARLLASDLASVFDRPAVVDLLEKLAAALAVGRHKAISQAARRLREALSAAAGPHRRRSFWR